MPSSLEAGPSIKHDINVTPLADVMLVLLIIFMVITPLLHPGVEVQVPEAEHSTEHPEDEETLVLSLKGNGSIYLNEDILTESDLLPTLTSELGSRRDRVLYLKANELLDYGSVLEVMELCRRAGADEVALITRRKNETASPPSPKGER